MRRSLLLIPLLAIASMSSSGCATNSELRRVRTEAQEARRTADQALTLAQEANRRSEKTEEMVYRGFRHGMRK
ncbi:MAG: alanine-zipper protein [Pseudomonadota bacterium]|jgi:hypothetical protein